MNECFFYDTDENGFSCRCINTEGCPGKACAFHKTKEEITAAEEKTKKRLSSLSVAKQEYIKMKYGLK